MPLGKAITGFINYKTAEGLSQRSVDSYKRILEQWAEYSGNKTITQFTDDDINTYLVYMRTEYVPRRWSGDTRILSPKTLRNIWITMCSFFRWANTEFHIENPMKHVPAPRFQKVDVEPFTWEEVARMLKACTYSREADTSYRRQFVMRRPTANRDQAVILTLLDSCVRASEFCAFRIGDFDVKRVKLDIRHGAVGGAKGGKGRTVYLGKTARHALWRYLAEREDGEDANAPLFVVRQGRPFNPSSLRHIIKSIAGRAGVKDAHPHRFRHTGAITYLRSGGDVFTLQSLLGHGSLEMVRHYARIAQVDVEQAHRKASPVDNWRLFRFLEGPYADPFNNSLYTDVITLTNSALIEIDKMSMEEIYYWRGMAKANLEDWDGAAQDLRRAHLLNPNFLPAGKELQRINSLGLTCSLDDSQNPVLTDLISSPGSSFTSLACLAVYPR